MVTPPTVAITAIAVGAQDLGTVFTMMAVATPARNNIVIP